MKSYAPVWNGYFADPFVLRTSDGFYAFGTDGPEDLAYRESGRKFPVLFSSDLRKWHPLGGSLEVSPALESAAFWAPAVAEADGAFVMYYSSGGVQGEGHALRVAVSDRPEGPYRQIGEALFPDLSFSIDAHPFPDPLSGNRYLYFARDFLNAPVGTGLAVARLDDTLQRVVGKALTILRCGEDSHLYERDRTWYGKRWRRWHTCEGPSVTFREGRYWLLYSGGNWHNEGYGVWFAVADSALGPFSPLDRPLLASGPGLRGPGHCATFEDAKGESWIVFHAWDSRNAMRQMHLCRMRWSADGPEIG